MGASVFAIESMGFQKNDNSEPLSLKFFGCYVYVSDSINLDESIGIYCSKYRDVEVYIGSDVLAVYKHAMGCDMFVGPGGAQESDLKPYAGKVVILVKPTRSYKKSIFDYYYKNDYGVCFLYDAFREFKVDYISLVSGTINRCVFDLKANYYSIKGEALSLEYVYFDFFWH